MTKFSSIFSRENKRIDSLVLRVRHSCLVISFDSSLDVSVGEYYFCNTTRPLQTMMMWESVYVSDDV